MIDKKFVFLAGHHRSGTSLLHEIIREHPFISGFSETGAPEDEGQHLQSVYEPAKTFGGPGKYIYDPNSYMNEQHELATELSAKAIIEEWEQYYDTNSPYYIEKSPPNLIRTRFLQKLFPNSKFIVILRHPIVVGYATQKWSKTSIKSLIEHSLRGYEIFMNDIPYLSNVYVVRYEDFVDKPQKKIKKIYEFLNLEPIKMEHVVRSNVNEKYFSMWRKNRASWLRRLQFSVNDELERRANRFGYSMKTFENLISSSILGVHNNQIRGRKK